MSSPAVIDIAGLLEPISEENPTGVDLRQDTSPASLYSRIKDARTSARAAERNSVFDGGSSEADENWRKILELAPEILKTKSKDLEVCSWYTEALIRRHGFQGLRDGFEVLKGLLENYWENLYPIPDEDGVATRVSPLTGLNGEGAEGVLIAPIRNTYITESFDPGPFNAWHYKQALEIQKIPDENSRNERASKAGFDIADIEETVNKSSPAFYINLRDDISAALSVYKQISQMLMDKCGAHDSPPTSNITNTLEEMLGFVNHLAKNKFPVEEEAPEVSEGSVATVSTSSSGPVKNRADAFRKLHDIADFFRKTEPHSPISYVLDKAIKWGDMSLGELVKELIPDSSSRDLYGSLTGVRVSED